MRKFAVLPFALACLLVPNQGYAGFPEDLPTFTVTTYDSTAVGSGHVFVCITDTDNNAYYVIIVDNDGTPVWYQSVPDHIYDFKMLPNGHLHYAQFYHTHSWTGGGDVTHEILDSTYNHWESVRAGNGYNADSHDFQLLPNGHVLLMSYYKTQMDISQFVPGAYPKALMAGALIQELDGARNVIWQWRSWDHYTIPTYLGPMLPRMAMMPAARNPMIDNFHLNTVLVDNDGNLLISNYMVDIQKINRQTGEVMWRLGGFGNQFAFANVNPLEALGHFSCHTVDRLDNGNILLYTNADQQATRTSKVYEYHLDETAKVATLVWSYTPSTPKYAWHYGSSQRLPNGNTFIGWGGGNIIPGVGGVINSPVPVCTEVTADGRVVFEMEFDDPDIYSYRAYRFDWPPDNKTDYMEFTLASGNSYVFGDTGVTIDVLDGGGGYNEFRVIREPYAPVDPSFAGSAPQALPVRVKMWESGMPSAQVRVSFDAESFGLSEPGDFTLYHRPQSGQGQFSSRATTYNPVTGQLRTTIQLESVAGDVGEFILCYPAPEEVPYPPILAEVENYRGIQPSELIAPARDRTGIVYTVNQERPILLSWSPKGFARRFTLDIATDQDFTAPVLQIENQAEAFYVWSGAAPGTTYHYRVKSGNDGGESDWATGAFQTVPPMIQLIAPDGGDAWQRGVRNYVDWDDNLEGEVVIELYKAGTLLQALATTTDNISYRWEPDFDLVPNHDYSIRITSVSTPDVSDQSATAFSIVDAPVIDAVSLLQDPGDRVQLDVTAPGAASATVWGSPTLSPAAWQPLGTIALANGQGSFTDLNVAEHPQRFYKVLVP